MCESTIDEQLDSRDVTGVVGGETSDVPSLPSGVAAAMSFRRRRPLATMLVRPDVLMDPGLIAFTRIRRCFKSIVQVRAKERATALLAA